MRHWGRFGLFSLSIACVAAACSLENGGTILGEGADGSSGGDGTVGGDGSTDDGSSGSDGSNTDAAGDAAVDTGADTGPSVTYNCTGVGPVAHCASDCPTATFECGGSCVATCAGCSAGVYACDACNADGGLAVLRCEPEDASAFGECLAGFSRCPCPSDQGNCFSNNDTCVGNLCYECGDPAVNTTGLDCKVGTHTCKTDPAHLGNCF